MAECCDGIQNLLFRVEENEKQWGLAQTAINGILGFIIVGGVTYFTAGAGTPAAVGATSALTTALWAGGSSAVVGAAGGFVSENAPLMWPENVPRPLPPPIHNSELFRDLWGSIHISEKDATQWITIPREARSFALDPAYKDDDPLTEVDKAIEEAARKIYGDALMHLTPQKRVELAGLYNLDSAIESTEDSQQAAITDIVLQTLKTLPQSETDSFLSQMAFTDANVFGQQLEILQPWLAGQTAEIANSVITSPILRSLLSDSLLEEEGGGEFFKRVTGSPALMNELKNSPVLAQTLNEMLSSELTLSLIAHELFSVSNGETTVFDTAVQSAIAHALAGSGNQGLKTVIDSAIDAKLIERGLISTDSEAPIEDDGIIETGAVDEESDAEVAYGDSSTGPRMSGRRRQRGGSGTGRGMRNDGLEPGRGHDLETDEIELEPAESDPLGDTAEQFNRIDRQFESLHAAVQAAQAQTIHMALQSDQQVLVNAIARATENAVKEANRAIASALANLRVPGSDPLNRPAQHNNNTYSRD